MQDVRLLTVEEVHALCNVEGHGEPLLPRKLDRALLVEQREEGAAVAELRHDEHVALLRAKRQSERFITWHP